MIGASLLAVPLAVALATLAYGLCSAPAPSGRPAGFGRWDRAIGTAAYAVAYVLSPLRAPLGLLPYLTKLALRLALGVRYKTERGSYLSEALGIVGDVANLGLTTLLLWRVAGPPGSAPLVGALYVPLAAELVRLVCEKGCMVSSAAWQVLPHRRIAAAIRARRAGGSTRGRRRGRGLAIRARWAGGPLGPWLARRLERYCRYYALGDEERMRWIVRALKHRARSDPEAADRLAYLDGFRVVPDSYGLRAGRVRDVAAGEVFIHRRWTGDPDLLAGQALRRAPWIFDPRYLRRPFRYRSEADRLVTLFVLRHARYCPRYALYQFGHEIKAARYDLLFRALRRLGLDVEEPVREDGAYRFDPFLRWLAARVGRGDGSPRPRPLWADAEAIADIRRRLAAGEVMTARDIAARYTYPLRYVEEGLLPALAGAAVRTGAADRDRQRAGVPRLAAGRARRWPARRAARGFLAGRSVSSLLLVSALADGLLAFRIGRTGSWGFSFLAWNLALAWIPYLASVWAAAAYRRRPGWRWRFLAPGGVWLLFLPNAPYLATDLAHLAARRGAPPLSWYDLVTLAAFAWTGCLLGARSLRIMQDFVAGLVGRALSRLFVVGAAGLGGIGVYLGRFHRWSSWDVLLHPQAFLLDVLAGLNRPWTHLPPWGLCATFALFILICYAALAPPLGSSTGPSPATGDA